MPFLIDAQLPPGLADRLRASGHQARHVTEVLPGDARDADVLAEANRTGAVIVTKDQDFVDFALRGMAVHGVLWVRLGNTTNRTLWRKLEPLLPQIIGAFERGETLVELT